MKPTLAKDRRSIVDPLFVWKIIFSLYGIFYLFREAPVMSQIFSPTWVWTEYSLLLLGYVFFLLPQKKLSVIGAILILLANLFFAWQIDDLIVPHMPFINLLMLAFILWQTQDKNQAYMPEDLLKFLYIATGLLHFTAGATKVFSIDESWRNGQALTEILNTSPWVRPTIAAFLVDKIPNVILTFFSHLSLITELTAVILVFPFQRRKLMLIPLIGMHVFALFVFGIAQVSLGILLFLIFVIICDSNKIGEIKYAIK